MQARLVVIAQHLSETPQVVCSFNEEIQINSILNLVIQFVFLECQGLLLKNHVP